MPEKLLEMSLNFKADPCSLICGLDSFYTGNAKNYGSCPLDKILSTGYLVFAFEQPILSTV